MTELVGRFLSFEDHMGRGLVRLLYYVLLFLLVVTTAWELLVTFSNLSDKFWTNLWRLLVIEPFTFVVKVLFLRLAAELVMAILSIDDSLQTGAPSGDIMSSGLNVGGGPSPAPEPVVEVEPITEPSDTASSGTETKPEE